MKQRAKVTPSKVSDDISGILSAEVKRLRRKQRGGELDEEDLKQLLAIGRAMRELEETRVGAIVGLLGHRMRHRDLPDEAFNPLLGAMTGEGE